MWTHLWRIKRKGREESHIAVHVLMPVTGEKEGRRNGKPQSAGQLWERLSGPWGAQSRDCPWEETALSKNGWQSPVPGWEHLKRLRPLQECCDESQRHGGWRFSVNYTLQSRCFLEGSPEWCTPMAATPFPFHIPYWTPPSCPLLLDALPLLTLWTVGFFRKPFSASSTYIFTMRSHLNPQVQVIPLLNVDANCPC